MSSHCLITAGLFLEGTKSAEGRGCASLFIKSHMVHLKFQKLLLDALEYGNHVQENMDLSNINNRVTMNLYPAVSQYCESSLHL